MTPLPQRTPGHVTKQIPMPPRHVIARVAAGLRRLDHSPRPDGASCGGGSNR